MVERGLISRLQRDTSPRGDVDEVTFPKTRASHPVGAIVLHQKVTSPTSPAFVARPFFPPFFREEHPKRSSQSSTCSEIVHRFSTFEVRTSKRNARRVDTHTKKRAILLPPFWPDAALGGKLSEALWVS